MNWFNEVFDLAAVASGAGLAGGGGAAILAWSIKGAIMRFIVRTIITALLTGIGFYVLLGWLGFEIVPKDEVVAAPSASVHARSEGFLPQGTSQELAGAAPKRDAIERADDQDARRIAVKSPLRGGD